MKVVLAGAGAFGVKHLEAIKRIGGIDVVSVVGREIAATKEVAAKYAVPHATSDLAEALGQPGVQAAILATPTPLHASQALMCLDAGKHVQVEIPLADRWEDAEAVAETAKRTGLVAMVGHTRRFNPSHQWLHKRIAAGELSLQHMDVQTFFFRRTNINALGQARSWTDHLLWHHAAHTVDLFRYQSRSEIVRAHAIQGPVHPQLGIAMDMSIHLKAASGAICTLSLSFNNDGPLGTFFRYICDNGTYVARYDELVDGRNAAIDVSGVDVSLNGIELQDREFFAAIREGREPNASVAMVLPCYRTLHELDRQLADDGSSLDRAV
jgi:2-hydroxy-4-carboxymuconate semialdehyde hemiacetal dehydrogenase